MIKLKKVFHRARGAYSDAFKHFQDPADGYGAAIMELKSRGVQMLSSEFLLLSRAVLACPRPSVVRLRDEMASHSNNFSDEEF